MSQHSPYLREGDFQVEVITIIKGNKVAAMQFIPAKAAQAGDPSRLIQMAADLAFVKCQQMGDAPELAIAPSPEKPERDLRAEFEMNRKAAKVAGVVLKFLDNALMGSFVCHRADGKEWNPINDKHDCVHVIHSTSLRYQADGGGNLIIYKNTLNNVVARGTIGGFTNPSNRRLAVEVCVEWHTNRPTFA